MHRHSGASAVDICVRPDMEQVHLEISDDERGIPKKQLAQLTNGNGATSVGIAGMLERVRELRGSLQIQSNGKGTKVILAIPYSSGQRIQHGTRNRGKAFLRSRLFDGRNVSQNPGY